MPQVVTGLPDLDAQEIAALRRQKVADMLLGQSLQPVQPFSQAGAYVAPMHWSQGLAQVAQALLARKKGKAAEGELQGIADSRKAVADAAMEKFRRNSAGGMQTLPGTNAQLDTLPDPEGAAIELLGTPGVTDAQKQAGVLQYQAGVRKDEKAEDRLNRLEDRKLQLEGILANTALAGQQRADIAKQHDETLREIAAMRKDSQQEPAPSYRDIIDPKDPKRLITVDGRLYTPGGSLGDPGVIGVAGKEPQAAKADEARGTSQSAVTDLVTTMKDQYRQLREGGGIVDTESNPLANAANYVQSSGVGQTVGQIFGTDNQSNRNKIKSNRTALVNAIRKATGMSAKAMDSNIELQQQLEAASDPGKDFQAATAALDMIEQLYGGGKPAAAGAGRAAPQGVDPAVWAHMTPEEQALWP